MHLYPVSYLSPQMYALSLHDALPIFFSGVKRRRPANRASITVSPRSPAPVTGTNIARLVFGKPRNPISGSILWQNFTATARSEEHTSELQSLRHLVCRLLLEKKKKIK